MKYLMPLLLALVVLGCRPASEDSSDQPADDADQTATATQTEADGQADSAAVSDGASSGKGHLGGILEAQPEDIRARYDERHPRETLEFFGIEPGMTVVEGLPGGGWYTRILVPYLGSEGRLIAANYAMDMWPHFRFGSEEFVERMRQWPETFPEEAQAWCDDDCAPVSTFYMGSLPEEMAETADAVIYVRLKDRKNKPHFSQNAALSASHIFGHQRRRSPKLPGSVHPRSINSAQRLGKYDATPRVETRATPPDHS